MLTMIAEETENGNTQNDPRETTDSMSGMCFKEENLTFPRRSRCHMTTTKKIDWDEMLAKATEEDKKINIDITHPPDEYLSDNDENEEPFAPVNLSSGKRGSSDDMVLDLSSIKRSLEPHSAKKGYTLPSYQQQYKYQSQIPRGQPLKTFNSQTKDSVPVRNLQKLRETNIVAKKSLFTQREVYFEKEVVSQKHVSINHVPNSSAPMGEVKIREVEYIHEPVVITPRSVDRPIVRREADRGSQMYGSYNTPSQSQGYQKNDFNGHYDHHSNFSSSQPPMEHHQDNVFAVPEPPPKPRPSTKELVVNGKPYQILALLGRGGSSKVYLVLAKDNSLLAIKCVNLGNVDEKTKRDHLNEIEHLMKMQYCKHIIKIIDHQYLPSRNLLFAVMERGDTDLSRLLKERTNSGEGVPPEMILFYWSEMLLAVKSIHDNNIIHRDLKPANFLLVSGRLKLIDFGIASAIQSEQTSVFKDSQSGTPNYMSPEAWEDLGEDDKRVVRIGRKTDVWSLGCILYSFLYGKTPFQEYNNPMAKFRAIINPNHKVPFPPVKGVPEMLIESCRRCLIHDKNKRAGIDELLQFKSGVLMTPPEILNKLRTCLNDDAFESAKSVILKCEDPEKINNN